MRAPRTGRIQRGRAGLGSRSRGLASDAPAAFPSWDRVPPGSPEGPREAQRVTQNWVDESATFWEESKASFPLTLKGYQSLEGEEGHDPATGKEPGSPIWTRPTSLTSSSPQCRVSPEMQGAGGCRERRGQDPRPAGGHSRQRSQGRKILSNPCSLLFRALASGREPRRQRTSPQGTGWRPRRPPPSGDALPTTAVVGLGSCQRRRRVSL